MKQYTITIDDYHAAIFEKLAARRLEMLNQLQKKKVAYTTEEEIANFLIYDVLVDNDRFADRFYNLADRFDIDFDRYNHDMPTMHMYTSTWFNFSC